MDFITDDMSSDFAFIEQDFLKNCRGRLDEFQNVGWYGERSFRTSRPRYVMQNNVLRLIYNGAKIGDDYCLELIKNLYKVYHKKEYKQLKRFSKINQKYWETSAFVGNGMRLRGYVDIFPQLCIENNMGLRMQMIRTLAVLKTWNHKRF